MSRRSAGLFTASDVAQLPNDAKLLKAVLEEFIREKDAGWGQQCSWQGSVPTADAIGQIAGDAAALKLAIVEILAARQSQRQLKAAMSRRRSEPRRRRNGLSESRIERLVPGRHCDGRGHGLHALVAPNGKVRWVQRVTIRGQRVDLGLGPWPPVSLEDARKQAEENIRLVREGVDPRDERARLQAVPTLEELVEDVIRGREGTWKTQDTARAYRTTFRQYVYPKLGQTQVDRISIEQIADLVTPHWQGHGSIGYRILQKCVTVFEQAVVRKLRPDNPARAARQLMPKVRAKTRHFPSVPHAECGDAVRKIREYCRFGRTNNRLASLALELVVLTVGRTGEVRGAEWSEFDLERRTWTIPGERMKGGLIHRVPLSVQALNVLQRVRAVRGDERYVFGYRERGKPRLFPGSKMSVLMRTLELPGTPHGFRSSFRVWAGEVAQMPSELAELCLAHVETDHRKKAYQRSDYLDRRRPYMQDWADYVLPRNESEE